MLLPAAEPHGTSSYLAVAPQNPLGLVEALLGAMNHAATLHEDSEDSEAILEFTSNLRKAMHVAMVSGDGTRDLCGPAGLTTEQFVNVVAESIGTDMATIDLSDDKPRVVPELSVSGHAQIDVDYDLVRGLFDALDTDGNGTIDLAEFTRGLDRLNILPTKQMVETAK